MEESLLNPRMLAPEREPLMRSHDDDMGNESQGEQVADGYAVAFGFVLVCASATVVIGGFAYLVPGVFHWFFSLAH